MNPYSKKSVFAVVSSLSLRKFLYIFLLFFLFQILESQSTAEHLALGEKAYREKKYRQALANFKTALDENPASNKANLGFAKSSLALGSRIDSLNSYKKVLENDPKNKEALSGVAEIMSLEGSHPEALEVIEMGLRDEPYNVVLLIERATILLRMGRNELALRRLEEARKKINDNYEYSLLLAKANIANRNYTKATEIIEQLLKQYPDNADVFYEKAFLKYQLASRESNRDLRKEFMEESLSYLDTSLSLDTKHENSRMLGVKIQIWLGKYEDAYQFTKELLVDFPNDPAIVHYNAYLSNYLGDKKEATRSYTNLLTLDEMNIVGRYAIEDYVLKNSAERDTLRNRLGLYRFDLFSKSTGELEYKIANYHINRTNLLIPDNKKLRSTLIEDSFRFGDKQKLLSTLLLQRRENPDDVKISNRIENLVKKIKDTLSYREGFSNREGILLPDLRTEPEIFLFDLRPEEFIPDFPDTPQVLTSSLKFALSLKPQIKMVIGDEEKAIRDAIEEFQGKTNFTNSIYYSSEALEFLNVRRRRDNTVRYVGYGIFKNTSTSISVNYNIYDRTTGKNIRNININTFGRNRLEDFSARLADEIVANLPLQGKIIKVKKESVIINIGHRDGIRKGDVLVAEDKGKEFGVLKVTESDDYLSEAEFEDINWKKIISKGFTVKAGPKLIKRETLP
jgi:tetratricopeptide (TPR) repeat protein